MGEEVSMRGWKRKGEGEGREGVKEDKGRMEGGSMGEGQGRKMLTLESPFSCTSPLPHSAALPGSPDASSSSSQNDLLRSFLASNVTDSLVSLSCSGALAEYPTTVASSLPSIFLFGAKLILLRMRRKDCAKGQRSIV